MEDEDSGVGGQAGKESKRKEGTFRRTYSTVAHVEKFKV